MRFVIMADGKGTRWNNFMGLPKHLVEIDGEPIIGRTVRLLIEIAGSDNEIIITSHDERYEFDGARRYEPRNNVYEIDRFTEELVQDDMCFLYGDTYYMEDVLRGIVEIEADELLFFGNEKSIVALKINSADVFRKHFDRIRKMYTEEKIDRCRGWQIYQSYTGQNLHENPKITDCFIRVSNDTNDINTPEEYKERV